VLKFYMYRIKVERHANQPLFPPPYKPSRELISRAISENPSAIFRDSQEWLIGNVERPDDNHLLFAFGKITKSISEKYDKEQMKFTDVAEEKAPYTYIAIDLNLQTCAIGHKSKIASDVRTLSKRFMSVLNKTHTAAEFDVTFVLSEIHDTQEFIKVIRAAEVIKKFEVTFSPPNPFDADNDFHKPLENILAALTGKKGKLITNGENLDKKVIEQTVKSIASTGDSATVRLKLPGAVKFVSRKMSGHQVSIIIGSSTEGIREDIRARLLPELATQYRNIRGDVSEQSSDSNTP